MILDCHVHISATTPAHGKMSPRLLKSLPFKFMRWRFGISGSDARSEHDLEQKLAETIGQTEALDAAVVLAFDGVHDADGNFDDANTHLYVKNDYVMELCARHPKMLFGASVHPYRKDAAAEIERCVNGGAVLMKWLPLVQGFNPADERCVPFYEALAHHRLVLLSHTGGELSLPIQDPSVASPMLLLPALRRGVHVIAAHCGTRSHRGNPDFVLEFVQLAREHEHFYGDTAALNLPNRWYGWKTLLSAPVRGKLVHGSDWPIIPLPPPNRTGWGEALHLLADSNWLRRDVSIKKAIGLDDAYWHRAASVLGLRERQSLSARV